MSEKSDKSVKLFSYSEDQPRDGKGTLIPSIGDWKPRKYKKHTFTPIAHRNTSSRATTRVAVSFFVLCALIVLGSSGYGLISEFNLASAPIVSIVDAKTQTISNLDYGPQEALSKHSLFTETRDSFIDEGQTFIEADMSQKQIRFFERGVLVLSAEIFGVGEVGTWWQTPSGLYKVEKKDKKSFTPTGQVYLPSLITFQGNYLIHGWPVYPNGSLVSEDFTSGGIRLDDESAEKLYKQVKVGMPVLVHTLTEKTKGDNFVYEPSVSDLNTSHYFVADIDNDTILASNKLNDQVPIASLTKLMTAVVATEKLNLDGRIRTTSPTFVTSLIPRLAERSSVSTYSLLQLLLVESSNEAAEVIAGEVGREDFLQAMNAKARQLGMLNTQFADPSGLSADNTSTIKDLYQLTKYIYENKRFIFEITANQTLSSLYDDGEFGGLINFNELEDMDSFIGGKVGETLAAGQTSVSLHKIKIQGEDRIVVVIILGSSDKSSDIVTLISSALNRFDNLVIY